MERIKKNWPIVLLLLAIEGCMIILNFATLISPDDYSYAYTIAGEDLKITSFWEIISAIKYLYVNWTGRILSHLLVAIFMTTCIPLFKILNSLMFIALLLIITRFVTRKTTFLSIVTAFGFFVFGTMFGEKFAWISGSLNYLWTAVPLLLYLSFIYGYFVENRILKKWQKITLSILGLIVGLLHEVTAFVGGAFLGVLFLANIKKAWKKSVSDRIFLIGSVALFAIGCFITIFAPGNMARSLVDPTEKGSPLACLGNYRDIKEQLIIMTISIILVGVLKQKELVKKELIYFLLPCIIATFPFAIMGYFTPRCFVSYEALIIIVTVTNIQMLEEHFSKYKKSMIVIACVLTIVVFVRMLPTTFSDVRYLLPYKIKLTRQLEEARSNHEKDVVVSRFLFTDKICREKMINPDNFFLDTASNAVVNTYLSLYYQFDCIRAISDADYIIEIDTDITDTVDYGILNKDTLELYSIVQAKDKIVFTIPKEKFGIYVVDCRDKDLRSHVKSVRIRGVGEEIENPDLEQLINQEK